jgi:hypothetical protein
MDQKKELIYPFINGYIGIDFIGYQTQFGKAFL